MYIFVFAITGYGDQMTNIYVINITKSRICASVDESPETTLSEVAK